MTVALVATLLLTFAFAVYRERAFDKERERWRATQAELLNRIQRPEMIPMSLPDVGPDVEAEPDEFELVGTIQPGRAETSE